MNTDREPDSETRPGAGGFLADRGVPGHLAVLARGGRDGRTAALSAARALLDDWEDEDSARPTPAPVTVVLDGADDAAVTRALLAAHSPAAGRINVHPTPSATGANSLAYDVLAALGRPVTRLAEEKISGIVPAWQAIAAWVAAEEVEQITVLRAHTLARPGLDRLLELRARTGVALVLVWHMPALPPGAAEVFDGVEYRVVTDLAQVIDPDRLPPDDEEPDEDGEGGDLVDGRGPAEAEGAEAEGGEAEGGDAADPGGPRWTLPPLSEGDVLSFRAECFRRLPPGRFHAVDAVYQTGLKAACRWLSSHPEMHRNTTALRDGHYLRRLLPHTLAEAEAAAGAALLEQHDPDTMLRSLAAGLLCVGRGRDGSSYPSRFADKTGVQTFLGGLAVEALSRRHAITLLRGAQAGALLHGLLLALPDDLAHADGPGLTAVPFDYDTADRIRARIAGPVHAAALAAALFTGCRPTDLNDVRIHEFAQDTATFTVPGVKARRDIADTAVFVVPTPARPLLDAARRFLVLRGTPSAKRLFSAGVGHDGEVVRASAEAAGLPLPVTDQQMISAWPARSSAWWVGSHLHHPGEPHDEVP